MATPATVDLDKTFSSALDESYGTIDVRVVVLNRKPDQSGAAVELEPEVPADLQPDEVLPDDSGKTPLAGYLEDPKRGRECVVFTVNGQRQEAWDNTFIQRELGFKYLRNRTMIIVSLDGMQPEALADIMQGSREHFYPGTVYGAIVGRLTATLKKDPDLEALEAEAEREISQLRAGDEAVKQALDQLIEDHHQHGDHTQDGLVDPGTGQGVGIGPGPNRTQDVVVEPGIGGVPATGPYLTIEPGSEVIRLIPGEPKRLKVMTSPVDVMRDAVTFTAEILPVTEGLKIATEKEVDCARIALSFVEPTDIEDDFYPIEAKLRVVAWLKGHAEPRVLERKVVVSKPTKREPRARAYLTSVYTLFCVHYPLDIFGGWHGGLFAGFA